MATQSKLHRNTNVFTEENISKRTLKLLLLVCFAYILFQNEIDFGFGDNKPSTQRNAPSSYATLASNKAKKVKAANTVAYSAKEKRLLSKAEFNNLANQFHNVSFLLDPNLAEREDVPEEVVAAKIKACKDYVRKYAQIAKVEEQKMGIPASITLAQGILESDAGGSRLTKAAENHFGIKCFSNHCKKGHCKNFTDDTHKDFFVVYQSAWQSFRAHSNFLKAGSRYKSLFKLSKHDYKAWANGLKNAGYATDRRYNEKLIMIIERLNLDKI